MISLKRLLNESEATSDSVAWAKKFQTDLGLTAVAAAAMAGNIQHESGFISNRIQKRGELKTGTLSDAGTGGYSWAQWTHKTRKKAFRDFVLTNFDVDINKTPATNKHAYAFLKHEIKNYPYFDFNKFKKYTNITKATQYFVDNYEQSGPPNPNRFIIANEILKYLSPSSTSNTTTASAETITNSDCTMFPNPIGTNEEVTIRINQDKLPIKSLDIEILSVTGTSYGTHQWDDIQRGILKFDAPEDPGVYIIKLSTSLNKFGLKLLVR